MNHVGNIHDSFAIHYKEPFITYKLSRYLQSIVPNNNYTYIVLCIGTDRATGDCLGPLTGSLLQKFRLKHIHVYGTLHDPVHAINLTDTLKHIESTYDHPYIIAVDAALGNNKIVGQFHCGLGTLKPGSALNKELPPVGNMFISAVINVNSPMNHLILQSTRLSVVYDMAAILSHCIFRFDLGLRKEVNTYIS